MVFDKLKEKLRKQKYYQIHKEKIDERNKEWKKLNRDMYLKQQKEYNNHSDRHQSNMIKHWKYTGLKLFGYTYEEVYEYYLDCDNCEVCNKDISMGGYNKHMDHCHSTGIFRWILCNSCNTKDNWMNKI